LAIFTVPKGLSPPFTLVDESVNDDTPGASTFSVWSASVKVCHW
jgi:hypothetical protein